jgi:hypothetical protein
MTMERFQPLIALVFTLMVMACASTNSEIEDPELGMSILESQVQGQEIVQRFDLNGDGKPDVWKVQIELTIKSGDKKVGDKLLIKKKLDINFDGTVDITKYYNRAGALDKEEMDLDFDKSVDAVHYYREGLLYMSEYDMAFDGGPDLWKFYDEGKLVRKERDIDGDSRVDSWEYFRDGKLIRTGKDKDGDGEPEYFEDAPA